MSRWVYRVTPYVDGHDLVEYGSIVMHDYDTLQDALTESHKWDSSSISHVGIGIIPDHDLYTDSYDTQRGIWVVGGLVPSQWYSIGGQYGVHDPGRAQRKGRKRN